MYEWINKVPKDMRLCDLLLKLYNQSNPAEEESPPKKW